MSKVVCIGGPSDGRQIEHNGAPSVELHNPIKASDVIADGLVGHVAAVERDVTLYKLHRISTPDGFVEYLAPHDWDALRCLRHLLDEYAATAARQ